MVGFGVDRNAPRYPFVIPTLLYRKALYYPWEYILCPVGGFVYKLFSGNEAASVNTATSTTTRLASSVVHTAYMRETLEPDLGFGADEVI